MALFDIKLTDKGREMLAKGELTFQYYVLGDSEINYTLNSQSLVAKHKNPNIIFYLQEDITCNKIFTITGDCQVYERKYYSEKQEQGIFDKDIVDLSEFNFNYFILTGETYNQFNGDKYFDLNDLTSFQMTTINDGDILMIKVENDLQTELLEKTQLPLPYLSFFIKKQGLSSIIELDRNLPYWDQSGNTKYMVLPGNTNWYQSSTTIDFNSFDECGVCSGDTPVYIGLSNVFCQPVLGTSGCTAQISGYTTSNQVGLMSYLGYCGECPDTLNINDCSDVLLNTYEDRINQISILSFDYLTDHYFHVTENNRFKVFMPTIMWHRRVFSGSGTGNLLGMAFISDIELKRTDSGIQYYDLIEDENYIGDFTPINVGRVYPQLKLVVLHYPELIAVNSYFANRNWTLPALAGSMTYPINGIGNGILPAGKTLYLTYCLESTTGITYSWAQQKIAKFVNSTNIDRDIAFTLEGTEMLPYMRKLETWDGLGFYAHKFKILYQIVDSEKDLPKQYAWKAIDFTTNNITTNTNESIDPLKLERQESGQNQFILTPQRETVVGFEYYSLSGHCVTCDNNYIGDESVFIGNAAFFGGTSAYKRTFNIIVGNNISKTDNLSYETGQNLQLSEIGILDKNLQLVMIAKCVNSIELQKDGPTEIELEYFF